MPSTIWGYYPDDYIEFQHIATGKWVFGRVAGFTRNRNIIADHLDPDNLTVLGSQTIANPAKIRRWERPSTPDAIEEFLNR